MTRDEMRPHDYIATRRSYTALSGFSSTHPAAPIHSPPTGPAIDDARPLCVRLSSKLLRGAVVDMAALRQDQEGRVLNG